MVFTEMVSYKSVKRWIKKEMQWYYNDSRESFSYLHIKNKAVNLEQVLPTFSGHALPPITSIR